MSTAGALTFGVSLKMYFGAEETLKWSPGRGNSKAA
jgi:hypothetical protein